MAIIQEKRLNVPVLKTKETDYGASYVQAVTVTPLSEQDDASKEETPDVTEKPKKRGGRQKRTRK